MTDYSKIPTGASWNWDTFLEGSHISIEPGMTHRTWTITTNVALTAGLGAELITGSVLRLGTDNSTVFAGVATETAASGTHAILLIEGLARGLTASGTIAVGKALASAGSGYFKQWGVTGTAADTVVGFSLTGAVDGDTFVGYIHR